LMPVAIIFSMPCELRCELRWLSLLAVGPNPSWDDLLVMKLVTMIQVTLSIVPGVASFLLLRAIVHIAILELYCGGLTVFPAGTCEMAPCGWWLDYLGRHSLTCDGLYTSNLDQDLWTAGYAIDDVIRCE
jgi:hypothetical protein